LQYLKSRDLKPSRPRLAKMGIETSLETATKYQDSITGNWSLNKSRILNLKNFRTLIQKFWKKSGVLVWKS